jgi:hypothetical protein
MKNPAAGSTVLQSVAAGASTVSQQSSRPQPHIMATASMKNSSLQPHLAGVPASAWNAHLLSSLQPTAANASAASALQALLTSQAKNLNLSNKQGVNVNQSVVSDALPQSRTNNDLAFLLNQVGFTNLHGDASRATTLLSLLKNHGLGSPLPSVAAPAPNAIPPNSSSSPIQELASLLQQVQWQQMLAGGQNQTYQAQTQQALIMLIQEQMRRNGYVVNLGSQQGVGSQHGVGSQGIMVAPAPASPPDQSAAEQSRLKKTRKAHILAGQGDETGSDGANNVGKKRSSDVLVSSNAKKRREEQRSQQRLSPQAGDDSLVLDKQLSQGDKCAFSEAVLADHLVKTLSTNEDNADYKNHFGLQALIREFISLALSRRSFGLLHKASDLAVKFDIEMDTILSGVEKATGNESVNCSGGRMDYLLSMLLKPRKAQALPTKEYSMLSPNLPSSLLSHIAPSQCSSFGNLNVGNRWIFIRETSMGNTKFYCSPMFEKHVLPWALISKLYEDNVADIFSIIFADEHCDQASKCLAGQISMHRVEGAMVPPSQEVTQIRLLSESLSRGEGVKGHTVIDVNMMLSSVQTMDSHVCYFEFFGNGQAKGSNHLSHPPCYDEVKRQLV